MPIHSVHSVHTEFHSCRLAFPYCPLQDASYRCRVALAHGATLLRQLRTALPARFGVTVRYYVAATACLAIGAGLGLSILSDMSIQPEHRVLTAKEGFGPIDKTELALVAGPEASRATLRLADMLAEFCDSVKKAA